MSDVTVNRRSPPTPAAAQASNPRSSVAGPQTHTSAPAAVSVHRLLRATREWRTSPRITTLRPASEPPGRWRRSVYRSRSAWVGWACRPSPALMTLPRNSRATRYGAPEVACRMTSTRAPSASRVRIVSSSDSPFSIDEPPALTFTTSAERCFAATSKLTRVRVEAS